MGQLVGVLSLTLKGHGFDSLSGQTPGLQVQSLVREPVRGNQLMFLSYIGVSLSLSPARPLSEKGNEKRVLRCRFKKIFIYINKYV